MFYRILREGGMIVASTALFAPLAAYASSSWSAVTVNQSQSAWSPNHQVDLQQSAVINASTHLGNQASATSQSSGNQSLWVTDTASQGQVLTANAGITWQDNSWPAQATAKTAGSVAQWQTGWSNLPMMFKQDAGVWQTSTVGSTVSNADGTIWQTNLGAVGDANQDQSIAGATQAQGLVDPPIPTCTWCSGGLFFGGRLVQTVQVLVQNVLTF